MLRYLNLGYFFSKDSFSTNNNCIRGFNIPNESYWHTYGDTNILLLQNANYYWRCGYQNLGWWTEEQKKRHKFEGSFPSFIIIQTLNFWSIGRYQSSFINLTENSQFLILKFTQWSTKVYWRIPILERWKFDFFPKTAMFVVDLSNFSLKKESTGYFSPTNIPIMVFIGLKNCLSWW